MLVAPRQKDDVPCPCSNMASSHLLGQTVRKTV